MHARAHQNREKKPNDLRVTDCHVRFDVLNLTKEISELDDTVKKCVSDTGFAARRVNFQSI